MRRLYTRRRRRKNKTAGQQEGALDTSDACCRLRGGFARINCPGCPGAQHAGGRRGGLRLPLSAACGRRRAAAPCRRAAPTGLWQRRAPRQARQHTWRDTTQQGRSGCNERPRPEIRLSFAITAATRGCAAGVCTSGSCPGPWTRRGRPSLQVCREGAQRANWETGERVSRKYTGVFASAASERRGREKERTGATGSAIHGTSGRSLGTNSPLVP